jgi:hypothetical protein
MKTYPHHLANRITLVDIDGDSDFDLFSGNYNGRLNFFRNDGSPQQYDFTFITDYFADIDVGYMANPTFCDIESDNDYDLFIGESDGRIYYYQNDGDSSNWDFVYQTNYFDNIDVGDHASPEFCDIDGDGDYDLFVGREPFLGNQTMGDIFFYNNVGDPTNPVFEFATSNYLTMDLGGGGYIQLVDMDADQDLDVYAGVGHHIRHFENRGSYQLPSYVLRDTIFQNIDLIDIIPFFCDIDADGDNDLFAGTSAIPGPPGLHFYRNLGNPQHPYLSLESTDLVPDDYWVVINPCLADIDADDDYDLFISDNDNTGNNYNIRFYENVGTPNSFIFSNGEMNWQGIDIQAPIHRTLRFFDIDRDGDLDLFFNNNWTEGSENLRYYENTGSPQVPNMTLVTTDYIPFEVPVPAAWFCDIDSNGYDDLFIGDLYGGILFFHGIDDSSGFVYPRIQHPLHGIELSFGPNPANPVTWVTFNLPYPQKAELAVYNLLGQKVATLVSGYQPPGTRTYFWNATNTSSGTYFIRLETENDVRAGKVVMLR